MKAEEGQTHFEFPSYLGKITGVQWSMDNRISHVLWGVTPEDLEKLKRSGSRMTGVPAYYSRRLSRLEVWPPCPSSGTLLVTYQPPEKMV